MLAIGQAHRDQHAAHKARRARLNPPERIAALAVPPTEGVIVPAPSHPPATPRKITPADITLGKIKKIGRGIAFLNDQLKKLHHLHAMVADETENNLKVPKISVMTVQRVICKSYHITREQMCSDRRSEHLVWPRHVAMYVSEQMTASTFNLLGRLFGGRDHTTVLHAVKKIAKLVSTDAAVAAEVAAVMRQVADEVVS